MNLHDLYCTSLWEDEYSEFDTLKEEFLSCIQNHIDEISKNQSLNDVRGFQSEPSLTKIKTFYPLFEYVSRLAISACQELNFVESEIHITSSWYNLQANRSHFFPKQSHKETFTGILFLKVPENSGKLVLENLGINSLWQGLNLVHAKSKYTSQFINIKPTEGHIFMWPSYVPYSIESNLHDNQTIAIMFNILALPNGTTESLRKKD